jgi:hypothetical protein
MIGKSALASFPASPPHKSRMRLAGFILGDCFHQIFRRFFERTLAGKNTHPAFWIALIGFWNLHIVASLLRGGYS